MLNKIINFKGISFHDYDFELIVEILENKGGVLVAPAASALVNIYNDKDYYNSLIKSDIAILDSGFFCILWLIFKKQYLRKLSGYLFLKKYIKYLDSTSKRILLIDPTEMDSKINNKFLKKNNIYDVHNYVAPIYKKKSIIDPILIKKIKQLQPDIIILNIGGQIQEVLGNHIKDNINKKVSIICTGAAIAFMTGRQAPINTIIDMFYLGWLVRLIFGPTSVALRILKSFLLIKLFIMK